MYTDTKNLANLCANNTNSAAVKISNQQQDDKFKLKKVWKPLLRLISPKSAGSTTKTAKRVVPNNVNLNNATSASTNNTPKDLLFTSISSEAAEQDQQLLQPTHKLSLADYSRLSGEQVETRAAAATTTHKDVEFISRVSVDKTPLNTCNNCEYGRNCQHTKYHQHIEVNSIYANTTASSTMSSTTSNITTHQSQLHPQDLNILQAEDGCFVWSDSCGDIDEQLLRQWFWQNSWQFAENATMC